MNKLKPIIDFMKKALKGVFRWYVSIFKGRPWYIKLLSSLATFIVVVMLYLLAVDVNLFWLFGKSPSMNTIVNTRPAQASEIYSADSVMIGKFFSENRTPVSSKM